MLIRFFKQKNFIQFVGLLILGFVLWISVLISPPAVTQESVATPLYNFILIFLNNHLIIILLTFLFLISQAIYLNQLLIKHDLIPRSSCMGAFVYLVLMSYSSQLLHLHPSVISSCFAMAILDIILRIKDNEQDLRLTYKAGLLVGLASLFYFPSIILLIFIWAVLLAYRMPYWRQWILPIVGILTPYLFLFTIYFWYDTSIENLNYYASYVGEIRFLISNPDDIVKIILALLILLIIISILRVMGRLQNRKGSIRKKISIILYLFLCSILIMFLNYDLALNTTMIYIPSAIFLSIYFSDLKKHRWTDLVFTLLVILIIYNNYSL